jgi:ankyrin repeat protein
MDDWSSLLLQTFLLTDVSKDEKIDYMNILLDHNADVNAKNKYNQTALHYALS